ncbi:MAG: nucleotidyl transferase AbiEii/AbiGii toxin family protein [Solirubrobacterales bacterium]
MPAGMVLEQRLKDRADGDGARLARDRKRVAFDRLLARLQDVGEGRWLLKGGFALDLRLASRARSTKDIDIEWRAEESELLDTLLDAAGYDSGDFFVFSIERAGVPEDRLGGSHRFRVSATLASRPFETFLLDVGLRADEPIDSETLHTDDLLGFAGIDPVQTGRDCLQSSRDPPTAHQPAGPARRLGDSVPTSRSGGRRTRAIS